MKLLIDIPKEFERHFKADRFEDSLYRLNADAHLLAGIYEQETALMLIEAFKNAVVVPPHGDLIDKSKIHKAIPAEEVAPVVRCRDCQSYNKPRLGFCETHLVRMHGDDFCSYGKKREER